MKTSTFLVIIGIVVIVFTVGYYLYKRRKKSPTICIDSARTEPNEKEKPSISEKPTVDVSKIPSEFSKCAKYFIGIYEALYQVADGSSEDELAVLADWNNRIEQIKDCPNFTNYWYSHFDSYKTLSQQELQNNATDILKNIIFECGINRDKQLECIVDENTSQRYYAMQGAELIIGDNLKIAMPCWQLDSIILEKGILTK